MSAAALTVGLAVYSVTVANRLFCIFEYTAGGDCIA
jgi:hypothetical protein